MFHVAHGHVWNVMTVFFVCVDSFMQAHAGDWIA